MSGVPRSDWREGFLFVGNHLFLDFINTRPQIDGEPRELLPDWDSLIAWFGAAKLLDSHQAARFERAWARSREAYKTMKEVWQFREKMRKDLLAWEGGASVPAHTLQELNDSMARHPMLMKIKSEQGALEIVPWFELRKPTDLFAPLARAAADLFSQMNPARVRKCEHCVLHFHDTSKIGTRRWCSMRLCGNRAKVAAYAARLSARSA
ncbi:MAG TPA: ABATE domain-containing protein [Terriglobales bacterium]|nr:ABATE domain-containing protein [Terriglobales bacterium]